MPNSRKLLDLEYAYIEQKALLLNLELPPVSGQPCPVIVYIHGGGWAWGSKDEQLPIRQVDQHLLQQGYAIASINYRLSGEAIFPAQIIDCKAAIRWLRANAAEYRLDPARIGVWGFSAGAHLAALLGTSGETSEFDREGGNFEYSSQVQAVAAFAPVVDFSRCPDFSPIAEFNTPLSPEARLLGGPIQENLALAQRANPLHYLSQNCPPFLIIHGEADEVVPIEHSLLLNDVLKNAGVESTLYIVPGGGHGIGDLNEEESSKIIKMISGFFDIHLKK
jgi:acetyl esterase/lipase